MTTQKTKDFSYEGKGSKGQKVTGNITANSPGIAKALLKKQGITVSKMKVINTSKTTNKTRGRTKAEDITIFRAFEKCLYPSQKRRNIFTFLLITCFFSFSRYLKG